MSMAEVKKEIIEMSVEERLEVLAFIADLDRADSLTRQDEPE